MAGISMGVDGHHLFMANDEMRKQFSFEAVSAVVEPPRAATFIADVTLNGVKKQGAEVSIVRTSKTGVTDANGKCTLTQLQDGQVVCKIVCDGCPDQRVNVTLSAGTTSRISVALVPLFTGEMMVGSESSLENHPVAEGA
ncbi:MAG: carboxypeptidase-like regulatory domain-containing protein [Bacteroidia bacterium]